MRAGLERERPACRERHFDAKNTRVTFKLKSAEALFRASALMASGTLALQSNRYKLNKRENRPVSATETERLIKRNRDLIVLLT